MNSLFTKDELENKVDELNMKVADLETENKFWAEGYELLFKENIDLKIENEDLKNAYIDDLTDVINTLVRMQKRMAGTEYKFKHAKEN